VKGDLVVEKVLAFLDGPGAGEGVLDAAGVGTQGQPDSPRREPVPDRATS
jgi:hypothetical protein